MVEIKKSWFQTDIRNSHSCLHIWDIIEREKTFEVVFKDECPKKEELGDGELVMLVFEKDDSDDMLEVGLIKEVIKKAKEKNICPEVRAEIRLSILLSDLE